MKTDIADVHSGRERHAKGLNGAIEILVIKSILIVPDPRAGIGHFVAHKPDAIITWVWLSLVYNGSCPSRDGRLHPNRRTNSRECEAGWATDHGKLPIRSVVIHVTLTGMRLAPRVFVRSDILGFSEISRARILWWIQVAHCDSDPMRRAGVTVAAVIVRGRWVRSCKWIHPRT